MFNWFSFVLTAANNLNSVEDLTSNKLSMHQIHL